jgi:hypothetical protein
MPPMNLESARFYAGVDGIYPGGWFPENIAHHIGCHSATAHQKNSSAVSSITPIVQSKLSTEM